MLEVRYHNSLKTGSLLWFSYSYTGIISGAIFNQRNVVEELDLDEGTESNSKYCYEPA